MPYRTDDYESITAETVVLAGHNGDPINAFYARPAGGGPHPAMVLIHHMPGWDSWYKETTFKFAREGYATICPNLYARLGHGSVDDVFAMVRNAGGAADAQVVGDVEASARYVLSQPYANGKVGLFGTCSGGRHTVLTASLSSTFAAAIDLWGGGVVMRPEDLNEKRPVAPINLTKGLSCPLLGIFGNDDRAPTAEQVDIHEAELKKHGKEYEFHRYDGAAHGFFYYDRPQAYRAEQAVDAWTKIWPFLEKHLR